MSLNAARHNFSSWAIVPSFRPRRDRLSDNVKLLSRAFVDVGRTRAVEMFGAGYAVTHGLPRTFADETLADDGAAVRVTRKRGMAPSRLAVETQLDGFPQ